MPFGESLQGEPDAGDPHVRFDEGKGRWTMSVHLLSYSTGQNIFHVTLPTPIDIVPIFVFVNYTLLIACAVKDLIRKTICTFSLIAFLSCGSSLPSIKDVTELAPPQNVSMFPENGQITIVWDDSIHEDEPNFAGYNLYYSRKSLMFAPIQEFPLPVVLRKNQHSYILDNLDRSVKYFVHVRSRDLDGNLSFPSLPEVIIPPASSF